MATPSEQLVLVTGGSGFVGAHTILQLLEKGYKVRTTVRSLSREAEVREMLREGGASDTSNVSFVAADLSKDDGWGAAVKDCTYVHHVASPFPPGKPKHEDELIKPAREGTLRLLRAAKDAGVRRVVLTSSFAAIGYGNPLGDGQVLTEKDWSNPNSSQIEPYPKSKTLAERAAWDFIEKEGGEMELAVVNPVGIFGPILSKDFSPSIQVVQRIMNGSLPGAPQLSFGIVDVRDVVDLHLRAMTSDKAKGERFLAVSGDFMSMLEISQALRKRMPNEAKKAPTRNLPNFLLRIAAWFDPAIGLIVSELGKKTNASNEKAKTVLGWEPRSREDALVATAESLIKYGVLKV